MRGAGAQLHPTRLRRATTGFGVREPRKRAIADASAASRGRRGGRGSGSSGALAAGQTPTLPPVDLRAVCFVRAMAGF